MRIFENLPADRFYTIDEPVAPVATPIAADAAETLFVKSKAFAGARHEADVLYQRELEALARDNPNVRHEVTLSRPEPSWTGRRGYVQAHVPELLAALREAAAPAVPHVYVCGLERMVKSVRELCRGELGVGRREVHAERYD